MCILIIQSFTLFHAQKHKNYYTAITTCFNVSSTASGNSRTWTAWGQARVATKSEAILFVLRRLDFLSGRGGIWGITCVEILQIMLHNISREEKGFGAQSVLKTQYIERLYQNYDMFFIMKLKLWHFFRLKTQYT